MDLEELRRQATHCYRSFVRFNRLKLRRVLSRMSPDARDTFLCIPQLIHVNIPGMPGHIHSPSAPEGIVGFERSGDIDAAFDSVFPGVRRFIRPPLSRPVVEHLSVMGSLGSIAHTSKSDCDYWVCVDGQLVPQSRIDLLQRRLANIEDWAMRERGLEVHFFVLDVRAVRENDFGSVDGEGCGSAQAKLLKEEFYRTCTVVTGRVPMWWMTPPGTSDSEFQALIELNKRERFVDTDEMVDFGNISQVPTAELLGATLWQLTKSLTSPFKSLLKMALLACYVESDSQIPLLADILKERVMRGVDDEEQTDPYLLMFDTITDYYLRQEDPGALALVQKCFYLQVARGIGEDPAPHERQRQALLREYLTKRNLSTDQLSAMDKLRCWDLEEIHNLGVEVRAFMLDTYRFLRGRAESLQSRDSIRPADLTVLGRKLASALGEQEGKIPRLVNSFVGRTSSGARLRLQRAEAEDALWELVLPGPDPGGLDDRLVLRGDSLMELMLLLSFNRLLGPRMTLDVVDAKLGVRTETVRTLMQRIAQFCAGMDPFATGADALLQPPRRVRALAIFNLEQWGVKHAARRDAGGLVSEDATSVPMVSFAALRPAVQRVAHRRDFFNDGEPQRSVITNIQLAYLNSWGELFLKTFEGPDALVHLMHDLLYGYYSEIGDLIDGFEVWSPRHPLGGSVLARLKALVDEAHQFLHGTRMRPDSRRIFILRISGRFHGLMLKVTGLQHIVCADSDELRRLLSAEDGYYLEVDADPGIQELALERHVYREQRRDGIQIFLRRSRSTVSATLLDELGRLRVDDVDAKRYAPWLSRRLVLMRSIARRNLSLAEARWARSPDAVPRVANTPDAAPAGDLKIYRVDRFGDGSEGFTVQDVTASVLSSQTSRAPRGIPLRIGGVVRSDDSLREGLQVALDLDVYEVAVDADMQRLAADLKRRYPHVRPRDIYIVDSEVELAGPSGRDALRTGAVFHLSLADLVEKRIGAALLRVDRPGPAAPGAIADSPLSSGGPPLSAADYEVGR